MPDRKSKTVFDRLTKAGNKAVTRSDLTAWLEENRAAFADLIAEHGPRWRAFAAILADEKLLGADERKRAETLRGAWRRVEQRHAKAPSNAKAEPRAAALRPVPDHKQPGQLAPIPSTTNSSRAEEQIARMNEQWAARKGRMPEPL